MFLLFQTRLAKGSKIQTFLSCVGPPMALNFPLHFSVRVDDPVSKKKHNPLLRISIESSRDSRVEVVEILGGVYQNLRKERGFPGGNGNGKF